MNEDIIADLRTRLATLDILPTAERLREMIALLQIMPQLLDLLATPSPTLIEIENGKGHFQCVHCSGEYWEDVVYIAGTSL